MHTFGAMHFAGQPATFSPPDGTSRFSSRPAAGWRWRGRGLARGGTVRPQSACCVCAAFALGAAGSNACPPSYSPLGTEDMCKSAAAVAGTRFGGSAASSYYPTGCYWHTTLNGVYFNPAAGGAGNYLINITQPFCVGAPCGLPCVYEYSSGIVCAFRECGWQAQPRRRPRSALQTVRAAHPAWLRRGRGRGGGLARGHGARNYRESSVYTRDRFQCCRNVRSVQLRSCTFEEFAQTRLRTSVCESDHMGIDSVIVAP